MKKLVAIFLGFGLNLPGAVLADDVAKVAGTWKLVSFWNEFQDGSDARPTYGKNG